MNENNVDLSHEIGYNDRQSDAINEYIDLIPMPVLNDVECQHSTLVPDQEDTIGDAIYHGCSNPKCGRGWYIRPNANKNIT